VHPATRRLPNGLQVACSTPSPPLQHTCAKFRLQACFPRMLVCVRAHASWQFVDAPGHSARQDSALRFVLPKAAAVAGGFAYSGASLPFPGAHSVAMT
jgi:hypothetical protein